MRMQQRRQYQQCNASGHPEQTECARQTRIESEYWYSKIIDALNAKDREAVKAAFSSSALDETGDIEDGIDYLFALIPDEIQDCVEDKRITSTSRKDGHNKEDMKTWYIVSTESNTYAFFLLENTIDNEQPENLGIYTLRACKEEDKAEHFSSWQKMKIAGIYVPDES